MTGKKLEKFAKGKVTGNTLLHGPYGSAKTTTAKMIMGEARKQIKFGVDWGTDVINGSSFQPEMLPNIENGWFSSRNDYAYSVIDEFVLLSPENQFKARELMGEHDDRNGFILTTNCLNQINGAKR